jgi:two-component system, cell cycle sensor histidine kinase and response regulator CckA
MQSTENQTNHDVEILIVEDSATQAALLQNTLERNNYRVSVARNGEEAISVMGKRIPTLLISDINMPGMDGYQLCRRIREDEKLRDVPVILLTSLADPKDVLKGLECGADNFITKPYDPKQLFSRIENICSNLELRRNEKMQKGVDVFFGGQRHFITSERKQILDLLLATYEAAVQVNLELKRAEEELKGLNKDLESKVVERTAALEQELAERKRAERRILEQAALLDKARDAISVRDLGQRILFWNNAAERLYGWKSSEVLGKQIYEFLYNEVSAQEEEALKRVLETGEWSGELRQRSRSGRAIIVESSLTLLRDEHGRPQSVLIINTDITEKKELEEKFLRAQRMETIGALAGGVAHDLNNVLAPVLMASEMLENCVSDEFAKSMLVIIKRSAERGSEIVRQILSFAKGGASKESVLQLKHLMRELIKLAQQTFPKSIQITADIPNDLFPIAGDPTQIDQVLMNLLVNSRDAMERGGTLSVKAENIAIENRQNAMLTKPATGVYVMVTIADTGCGIPENLLPKIFEPFFTTKELGKGTGLGLSTVLTILKSHGGFAEVFSAPGKGTEFKIYFRAVASDVDAASEQSLPQLPSGKGEWLLLVDDEQALLEMSRVMLDSFGYHVLISSNGAEALRLFRQHSAQIAVLITDLMMPVIDGVELINAARQINPDLPVIITTGLGSELKQNEATDFAASAVLTKPFKLEELLTSLRRSITRQVPTSGGTEASD